MGLASATTSRINQITGVCHFTFIWSTAGVHWHLKARRLDEVGLYYFHERNGEEYLADKHGIDLPDLESVRREAVAGAREIIAAAILLGRLSLRECFEIEDAQGNAVLSMPFRSVIETDREDDYLCA